MNTSAKASPVKNRAQNNDTGKTEKISGKNPQFLRSLVILSGSDSRSYCEWAGKRPPTELGMELLNPDLKLAGLLKVIQHSNF